MADINAGTGLGLREFLERAGSRGDLNRSTANVLKAASSSVLSVEDDPDNVDVRTLDVEATLERFTTLNKSRYTPGSMKTYQSRFRNAVAMYTAWLDNDPNWRKVVRARKAPEGRDRTSNSGRTASTQNESSPGSVHVADTDSARGQEASQQLVIYRLPLRPNLMVQLTLPADLTSSDAARIAGFVRSLAFDDLTDSPPASVGTANDSRRTDGN